jgi:hypothetical protein
MVMPFAIPTEGVWVFETNQFCEEDAGPAEQQAPTRALLA